MKRLAALTLLAACASQVPTDARPLTKAELRSHDDIRLRWEQRVSPLSQDCQAYYGRALVLPADNEDCRNYCARSAPDAEPTRFGRKSSCFISRGRSPIAVIWEGLSEAGHDNGLRHELTHALGHCERVPHEHHDNTALWGADGVHPL